jgi:hypothetical protein
MASSTKEGNHDAPKQHDTPHMGKQGDAPKTAAPPAAKPVLFDDLDPVLLVRLYGDAINLTEAKALAMKAGLAVQEEGAKLVAAQQQDMAPAA